MPEKKSQRWREVMLRFIELLRIDSKEVEAVDEKGSRLELWGSQTRFLNAVCDGMDKGIRRFICLKSRQVGLTTLSLVFDVFFMAMYPATIGALVTDTPKNSAANRRAIRRYVESIPKSFFGKHFAIVDDNRDFLTFSNGSRLDLLVAGARKKSWGEGSGYVFAHCCLARGTPVILEHGRIKAIEDVRVGDRVITHTGALARIVDAVGQPNTKGPMIKITPWMGHPVLCTTEHTIPTKRGIVEAKDLRLDDWLIMPVRQITGTGERHAFRLPITVSRRGWLPVVAAASGKEVVLDEELGFAIGYYLAEGSILRAAYSGKPSGITFARHRSEQRFSDRAVAALKPFITGHVKTIDRKDCLTTSVVVYGTSLATWVERIFGACDDKKIPDEVFGWGEDFCRGLLVGLFCGDGSKHGRNARAQGTRGGKLGAPRSGIKPPDKAYVLNRVVLSTIRASLANQARDLVASLGYGWGSISYEDGENHYGRMCTPCWRVSWCGAPAEKIRALMGLLVSPRGGHDYSNKYKIEKNLVFLKIKNIEKGFEEPEMFDLSVDHADHTFRTPYMSVGNTEVANYGSKEGFDSFMESLSATHPNRLLIIESTAKGFNWYRDLWVAMKKDIHTSIAVFVGWWSKDLNIIKAKDPRYATYAAAEPSGDEKELIDTVKEQYNHTITKGQLAWYRWRAAQDDADINTLYQNQPWTEGQAFVMTGFSFFATRVLQDDLQRIQNPEDPISFKGYRYLLGNDFQAGVMEPIHTMDRIDEVRLRVWEDPIDEATYAIGMDVAWGRNDWGDRTSISVWRCFADKLVQVAEYADSDVDTRQAAWVLAHLAGAYKNCLINIELTGGPGMAVMTEFDHLKDRLRSDMYRETKLRKDFAWDDFLSTARWYLYHKPDSLGAGYAKGWISSHDAKWRMLCSFKDSHTSGMLVSRSVGLVEEMLTVVQDGSEIGAPGRAHDDRVFAAGLANLAWVEWSRPGMIAQGLSYEAVMNIESQDAKNKGAAFVDQIVMRYFARQEEYEEPLSPRQQWLEDKGFA